MPVKIKQQIKSYEELCALQTFEERFTYLKLNGRVSEETFGFDRHLNQKFYRSAEWRKIRNEVILRDNGCDLGIEDRPIKGPIYIHHMNPITVDDLIEKSADILKPNFLVCVSKRTHDALHYSNEELLEKDYVPRIPGDTTLWSSRKDNL